ncbi:MAG TPA: hypothetical protein VGO96_06650 [Pyrinomonadaceae bacterium]|jgi:hypothetical protein|nr:hypothetical protein [Pyrinomonadaceae bacterium]
MSGNLNTAQLGALVWLKWRLFLNAMRSRRGAANRFASILGTLAALAFSLLIATGFGFGAYFVIVNRSSGGRRATAALARDLATGASVEALLFLFLFMSMIYLMWAFVPLSLGGGEHFDPGRLLLYPVSLRKLFVIDLLSELTSLASIFAAPSVFAIALGAGLARGQVAGALVVAACATLFGVALAKLLSTSVGALMQRKRTRGEALLAFLGILGALSGVALGQAEHFFARLDNFPAALRFTPPGAVAVALTTPGAGNAHYALSLAVLLAYTLLLTTLTYKIALVALRGGGAKRRRKAAAASDTSKGAGGVDAKAGGWRLPFGSEELSAIFEKELRYALRNAQLRTMALMPVILSLSLRMIGTRRGGSTAALLPASLAPYMEGSAAALSVLYTFLITSALSANLFGYESGGMRAYVLAPVARSKILLGKNLAMLSVSLVGAVAVTSVNALIYRDLTPRALLFTALSFVFFAAATATIGNLFSISFPKRLKYGKRMNASGVAGLLLLPVFLCIAAAPALAVLGGYAAESLPVEYVILAAFAIAGVAVYFLSLKAQGRWLARRELDILEAVTGRGDD